MKTRLYRHLQWGDRKHWQVDIGRLNVERWCSGAPCHLPGVRGGRHLVRAKIWNRSWSAADR